MCVLSSPKTNVSFSFLIEKAKLSEVTRVLGFSFIFGFPTRIVRIKDILTKSNSCLTIALY